MALDSTWNFRAIKVGSISAGLWAAARLWAAPRLLCSSPWLPTPAGLFLNFYFIYIPNFINNIYIYLLHAQHLRMIFLGAILWELTICGSFLGSRGQAVPLFRCHLLSLQLPDALGNSSNSVLIHQEHPFYFGISCCPVQGWVRSMELILLQHFRVRKCLKISCSWGGRTPGIVHNMLWTWHCFFLYYLSGSQDTEYGNTEYGIRNKIFGVFQLGHPQNTLESPEYARIR